jgi:hypothetical protein
MKMVKKYTMLALAVAGIALMPARANASTLTLNDGNDVWTLTVQDDGCTTCAITLSVTYGANSDRLGDHLAAVQWDLTDPNVNPTVIGFTGTTAPGTWTFDFSAVNNTGGTAGCDAGDPNAVCGQTSQPGATVVQGTWTWSFLSTFASPLNTVNTGNIRAGYDVDPDGNGGLNTIFSPNGGTFGGGGSGGGGSNVPEPASLLLFGAAAIGAVNRMRHRLAR